MFFSHRFNRTYEDPVFAFDLIDMQTAFFVYATGIVFCFTVFLLELYFIRFSENSSISPSSVISKMKNTKNALIDAKKSLSVSRQSEIKPKTNVNINKVI